MSYGKAWVITVDGAPFAVFLSEDRARAQWVANNSPPGWQIKQVPLDTVPRHMSVFV